MGDPDNDRPIFSRCGLVDFILAASYNGACLSCLLGELIALTAVKDLADLQAVDLQLDRVRKRLGQIETTLKGNAELTAARAQKEEAHKQLQQLQIRQKELEMDVETTEDRHKTFEARLMGGEANARELPAMQKELQSLKDRRAAFEEQELAVMNQVEAARAAAKDWDEKAAKAAEQWKSAQGNLLLEKEQLEAEADSLRERRNSMAPGLIPQAKQTYDRVRAKKGGVAVARVERGICSGCRISLPTTLIQRARIGKELVFCSSCGRILFAE